MSLTRIRVLHVEDSPGDARLMHEFLREEGRSDLDWHLAQRVDEALDLLAAEPFDVVLLDLSLPDARGLETVHRICEAAPQVPIVVLTGLDDENLAVRAVQVGAQDYLIKGQLDGHGCLRSIRYAIERHRSGLKLRSQSLMDEMTGLYNRRGFLALAEQLLRQANRQHYGLALVFCDLDDLKAINDTFGHQEGDRALSTTATILRETLRETDLVARMGGDEFVVLALDGSGTAGTIIPSRIRESFEVHNRGSDRPYRLSLSMGVACRDPRASFSLNELLADADRGLYEEKRSKSRSLVPRPVRWKLGHARTS